MDPSDESYLNRWRERDRAAEEEARAWSHARVAEARRAAQVLVEKLGVTRVVLFGSLAQATASPRSDVDLWVEGLGQTDYLEAVSLVRDVIKKVEVDLVMSEWASESLRERIARDGIVLHGR